MRESEQSVALNDGNRRCVFSPEESVALDDGNRSVFSHLKSVGVASVQRCQSTVNRLLLLLPRHLTRLVQADSVLLAGFENVLSLIKHVPRAGPGCTGL